MRIGLNDLEPKLAEEIMACAERLLSPRTPDQEVEARAYRALTGTPAQARSAFGRVLGTGALVGMAVGLTASAVGSAIAGGAGANVVGPAIMFGWLSFCGSLPLQFLALRSGRLRGLRSKLTVAELEALTAVLPLSVAERAYLDTVKLVIDCPATVAEETAKSIAHDLKDLLVRYRICEGQRAAIESAMSAQSQDDLERKRAELETRLNETSDPVARDALNQSLELLAGRLTAAAAVRPMWERLTAQQEVIVQTIASARSSLARLQAAPQALATPELDEIRRGIEEVTGQTTAVEKAVQEVLALGSG